MRKYFVIAALITPFLILPLNGALADTIGQKVNFVVNSGFDKYDRTSLSATLRYAGSNLYFYIDDKYWNGLGSSRQDLLVNNMSVISSEFDNNIYPKEKSFWGPEPNPGIDGDSKITLLMEELNQDNGGYFETGNEYTRSQVPDSNEREMIALNVEVAAQDTVLTEMFLTHEFQHLIAFNQKNKMYGLSEDVWLNELRSEYSISVTGYNDNYPKSNLDRRTQIFFSNPSDSLTEWPNKNVDYAMVTLFSEYLAEQFGRNILSETLHSPYVGINSLDQYFKTKGYYEKFGDVFLNWLGALYLNDVSQNSKLGYQRPELKSLRASPQQRIFLSAGLDNYTATQYIKDWQPLWLEYDVSAFSQDLNRSVKIELNGEPGQNYIASYLAFYDPPAGEAGSGPADYGRINIVAGQGHAYAVNSDRRLKKVVIMAAKATKTSNFSANEPVNYLDAKVSMVSTQEAQANVIKDGALIKKPVEKEIYVIWGKYKRYLIPGVIALYGHLNPANVIEVGPEVFDSYQTSNYVKYVGDEKVYAVWPDGTKHWLNITPQQWDASHRDWNAIFIINEGELNYYKTGVDITR